MANSASTAHLLSLRLYTSSRLVIQLIQSKLNLHGLTYPQYLVLSILWENDGLVVHKIGERLYLDSGTLTPLLKKLEGMNYVKRLRGEEDERTVKIELTYPGKSLQSKVVESLKPINKLFEEIQEPDLEILNQSLENLLGEVNEIKKK